MQRIYLSKEDIVRPGMNNLVNVTLATGEQWADLEPRRLFPVSAPVQYITFLDEEGTERCVARALQELSEESRSVVVQSLADYYLVPTIRKILRKEEKYGILHWVVMTERGERAFDIRNRNHDIRMLPDGRVRVRDSNDNRYIIESVESLDTHSRALLIEDL